MKRTIIIFILLVFQLPSIKAQTNCSFQIDTNRILTNQNLDQFLSLLKTDSLRITFNKDDIPEFIKAELDCLTHNFRIANPKERYNATDVIDKDLPGRQLIFLGLGKNLFLMQYYIGGIGKSTNLLLVKFNSEQILEIWKGFGLDDTKNIKDIPNFLETGRKRQNTPR